MLPWKILAIMTFLAWSPDNFLAAESDQACPESAAALAPAPLQEDWTAKWWMPRHKNKLQEEGRESAEVLFLGDSHQTWMGNFR